jgi:Transglutaminase-like superfamily
MSDIRLLAEAAFFHVMVKIGLRALRYSRLTYILGCAPSARHACASVAAITSAGGTAARRIGSATCLGRALVVHTMLRRHGHAAVLRIGVRRDGAAPFEAHAWVECNGAVVIGELPEMAAYAVLA